MSYDLASNSEDNQPSSSPSQQRFFRHEIEENDALIELKELKPRVVHHLSVSV